MTKRLDADEGSHVNGESVSVGFMPLLSLGLPALPVVLATIALGWIVSVFFGWVLGALFPVRLTRTVLTASRRTGVSLVLGLLWGFFTPVILVLLAVTIDYVLQWLAGVPTPGFWPGPVVSSALVWLPVAFVLRRSQRFVEQH